MSITSLRQAGGTPDNKELVSASCCDNATLSGRSSLKSMNSPLRILSTALAGTGGRADDRTRGTALPTEAGPRLLRGVANSEANEDMPEIKLPLQELKKQLALITPPTSMEVSPVPC